MKTITIAVEIKATVPFGKYCRTLDGRAECGEYERGIVAMCRLFKVELSSDALSTKIFKCEKCLDACANGFQKGLDELSEGMKKEK